METRKISVVTGSRAEYGLLHWIIKGIQDASKLELQLIVTGTHLTPEFGQTVIEIEKEGFPIAEKIEMILAADSPTATASSMGIGMIGFAKAYERLQPDILVVLGDRFEILSAVAASIPFKIPVAHIHGGEITAGAFDESIRHAVTKMSHIHFAATKEYRDRLIQMGESPKNVYCFGAPGLDNITRLNLKGRDEILQDLDLPRDRKLGIVTYHPVTLAVEPIDYQMTELLGALKDFSEVYWIFTYPNVDTGGRVIIEKINRFIESLPDRAKCFISLGQLRYLSMLKHVDVMVGNSSSGLIEAPSFELPVVNIGDRQSGRIRACNVIDMKRCLKEEILRGLTKAFSVEFIESLKGSVNPYGDGHTSDRVVKKLMTIPIDENLIKKRFHNLQPINHAIVAPPASD